MGFKIKLLKGQVFSQKLFDIMSKCENWKIMGRCKDLAGGQCPIFYRCEVVKKFDETLPKVLKRGQATPYLPGSKLGVKFKSPF